MHLTSTILLTFLSTLTLAIPIQPPSYSQDYDIDAIISEKHASILPSANLLHSYLTPSHHSRSLSEDLLLDLLTEDDDKTAAKLRSSKSFPNLGASLRKAISLPSLRGSRPKSPAPPLPPPKSPSTPPPPPPPDSTKPKPNAQRLAIGHPTWTPSGYVPRPRSPPIDAYWFTKLSPRPLHHQLGKPSKRDVVVGNEDDDDEDEDKKAVEGLVRFLVDEEEKRARAEWWRYAEARF